MTAKSLAQLLELRRRREKEALDELVRCQKASARAEEEAREAKRRVALYMEASAMRERELRATLDGHAVPLFEMFGIQAQIESLFLDQQHLEQNSYDAWRAYQDSLQPLAEARQEYRRRMQATAKIELLVQQEKARGWRSFAAIVEEEPFAGG